MRVVILLLIAGATAQAGCARQSHQTTFASAEEATQALVSAVRSDNTSSLVAMLGKDAKPLIDSGDPVQDRNLRQRFVAEYDALHVLDHSESGAVTLNVGAGKWPFPIPLVQSNGRWRFDSAAGAEEIVNRRVGANELATIQSCLAFVDAQREYYARNPQRSALLVYAQKFFSTEGRKDGLYWPTAGDDPPSPLGENFARARAEGYFKEEPSRHQPYHGYLYKLLTAQGPNAEGGAYDYVIQDKMLGGFGLIAFPAEYGSSGVMTFMVSHTGTVFSKDLGPDTVTVAQAIEVFDPDPSWRREVTAD